MGLAGWPYRKRGWGRVIKQESPRASRKALGTAGFLAWLSNTVRRPGPDVVTPTAEVPALCQCPRRHYWSATSVWPPGEWSCCRLCKRQGALGSLDSQYGSWLELEKWTVHWRWAPLQSAFPFLYSPHSAHSAQLFKVHIIKINWLFFSNMERVEMTLLTIRGFLHHLGIHAYIMFQKINLSTGTAPWMKMAARSHPQSSYNMP